MHESTCVIAWSDVAIDIGIIGSMTVHLGPSRPSFSGMLVHSERIVESVLFNSTCSR